MVLDATNLKILEILTRDARISYADLARAVGRAESTIRERVGALERRGVIKGYQAVVDPAELGMTALGIVRGSFDLRNVKHLERELHAIPQVKRALLATGAHPLLVEIAAQDLCDFEEILEKRLAPLELENVETDLFVRQIVPERAVLPNSKSPAPMRDEAFTITTTPLAAEGKRVATIAPR